MATEVEDASYGVKLVGVQVPLSAPSCCVIWSKLLNLPESQVPH